MARVSGAADPAGAIEQGLYVTPKQSVARRIVARLDLQPASTHLIVGGVGSGKTTQLLVARDMLLAEQPDTVAIYVDLSRGPEPLSGSRQAAAGLAHGSGRADAVRCGSTFTRGCRTAQLISDVGTRKLG